MGLEEEMMRVRKPTSLTLELVRINRRKARVRAKMRGASRLILGARVPIRGVGMMVKGEGRRLVLVVKEGRVVVGGAICSVISLGVIRWESEVIRSIGAPAGRCDEAAFERPRLRERERQRETERGSDVD
jgi:hypothetical protein